MLTFFFFLSPSPFLFFSFPFSFSFSSFTESGLSGSVLQLGVEALSLPSRSSVTVHRRRAYASRLSFCNDTLDRLYPVLPFRERRKKGSPRFPSVLVRSPTPQRQRSPLCFRPWLKHRCSTRYSITPIFERFARVKWPPSSPCTLALLTFKYARHESIFQTHPPSLFLPLHARPPTRRGNKNKRISK